jgi:hypothetical protein
MRVGVEKVGCCKLFSMIKYDFTALDFSGQVLSPEFKVEDHF